MLQTSLLLMKSLNKTEAPIFSLFPKAIFLHLLYLFLLNTFLRQYKNYYGYCSWSYSSFSFLFRWYLPKINKILFIIRYHRSRSYPLTCQTKFVVDNSLTFFSHNENTPI